MSVEIVLFIIFVLIVVIPLLVTIYLLIKLFFNSIVKLYHSKKQSEYFKKVLNRIKTINDYQVQDLKSNNIVTDSNQVVYYRLNQTDKTFLKEYLKFVVDTEIFIDKELRNRVIGNKHRRREKGYFFSEIFEGEGFESYQDYRSKFERLTRNFNKRLFEENIGQYKNNYTDNILYPKDRYYSVMEISQELKSSPELVIDTLRDHVLSYLSGETREYVQVEYSESENKIIFNGEGFEINEENFVKLNYKVKKGDLIGLGFNDETNLLNSFFKPVLGSLNDVEESKYNLYLFLGSDLIRSTQLGRKLSILPKNYHSYLFFEGFGLNVGYDKHSYLIYLFQLGSNVLNKGDLIIFKSGSEKVSIEINSENVKKRGYFYYQVKVNNESSNLTPQKSESVFTPIRISSKDLTKLKNLSFFQIYHYEKTSGNYYELKPHQDYFFYNESLVYDLFGYLLKNLPVIDSFRSLEEISDESVHVYLMYDESTNLYKIGVSNNPKYREKTLQGQIPKVNTVVSREFNDRKLSLTMEKTLHEYFRPKHVRGEWFDLSKNDLEQFYSLLGVKP